jgi:rhodanese-related sulfurtransferase
MGIVMDRIAIVAATVILAAAAAPLLAENVRQPKPPLMPDQISAHLAQRGLVLDVRAAQDCDVTLASAVHRATLDPVTGNAAVDNASIDLFIADVRRHRAFVQAQRNQSPVLVVCCGGVRSAAAAKALAARGFNARSLFGGVHNAALPEQWVVRH